MCCGGDGGFQSRSRIASRFGLFLFAMVMGRLTDEIRQESPWTTMLADDIAIYSSAARGDKWGKHKRYGGRQWRKEGKTEYMSK